MNRAVPGPVELDEAALRAAFEAPSSPERDRAMRRIARHADPRQLLELVADHKSAGARNGALAALERQGPIAVPVLEQVLASPDADDDLDEEYDPKDEETVQTIKELLDTRVRPAVANDGGDITFHGFREGVVYLHMRGACSGCPSSTATLRHGIENLLKHFCPDVQEVRPV